MNSDNLNIEDKVGILEPYKTSMINFKNILFKKIKVIKNKKIIFLKYHDKNIKNFVIQISKINKKNIINSEELEFEINDPKTINFFENLDNYIIEEAKNNFTKNLNHL